MMAATKYVMGTPPETIGRYTREELRKIELSISGLLAAPTWIIPTFLHGWVNFAAGGFAVAAYYKDPLGRVHLKGLIKSGTVGQTAFLLPVGYRPLERLLFPTICGGDIAGRVDIDSDGSVYPQSVGAGNNTYFGLDVVSFLAEQ
jgi:hypothetical protein